LGAATRTDSLRGPTDLPTSVALVSLAGQMLAEETEYVAAAPVPLDARRRRGILFVSIAVAAVSFAITAQLGLNDNFLANPPALGGLGIDGFQKGLIEAARETCGITALLIFVVLAGLVERTIGFFAIAVFAVGLGSYFWAYP